MRQLAPVLFGFCLTAPLFLVFGDAPAEKKPHQVELNGHSFTLPPGFVVEKAAGSPLVDRPITADLDDEGRLYLTECSGSIQKEDVQAQKKTHRVVRLDDTNGDGVFDKQTVFADKLPFPEGSMWLAGSLYVAAPPSIWKLTDADGDGVAERREEWFQGKTLTGCANDLHGPYRGPDGWVYWCKGAFAKQTYERPGRPPFVTRAAHIFRCRPDGSGLEPVMTGGMDNPVDVVFTPGGERVFTTTFLQNPGGGKRDGLIHAVYGGVYGKDHDPVYEHPWTGPELMPPLTHLGPAAPCGLARFESRAFGPEFQDNLFACLFNLRKVTRHALTPSGATFTSRDEDFLVSSNVDFHPTDVIEDADGSLLVVDTGGWYKLCCPTSQLVKPDVLGAVYRVRHKDAPKENDPRGRKLAWGKLSAGELVKLLDDDRPAVRQRAVDRLGTMGREAVKPLDDVVRTGKSIEARRNAVWALTRIDRAEARAAIRQALTDRDENVRQVALHSVSLWRDREATALLLAMLERDSAQNRRAAAEALGRLGDSAAVPALLTALAKPNDRVLEHSLIFALIEIGDHKATSRGLADDNLRTRRAALIALDQMGEKLDVAIVARELDAADARLKETASWLVTRHPEWGSDLADLFRKRLKTARAAEREEMTRHLARLAGSAPIQKLLIDTLRDADASSEAVRIALRAMAQAGLKQTPEGWLTVLVGVLEGGRSELLPEALATTRTLVMPRQKPDKLIAVLTRLGGDDRATAEVRVSALSAVPGGLANVAPATLTFLVDQLDPTGPVLSRGLAADALARARLNNEQLLIVADALKTAGPMEVNRLLEAFAQSTDERVGLRLLAALKEARALTAVRADGLAQRLVKYPASVRNEAKTVYALLDADRDKQQAQMEKLLASLGTGDVRRGQIVFNSTKTACAACHAIGYVGGKVGPDLTRVGQVRAERDLLESIVFPSVSLAQGFEPVVVTTKNGKVHTGLLRKNSPEEIVLTINATEEVRVVRDDIDELQPGKVSVMPAGLAEVLSKQELADLVAFLKACK